MQRRVGFLVGVCLVGLVCGPVLGVSVGFSTAGGVGSHSWTVTVLGGPVVQISFENNEIDASSPSPDAVLDDLIDLPTMNVIDLQKINLGPDNDIIRATLVPLGGGNVTITSDVASGPATAGQAVMSASLASGGILVVGNNYIAYSNEQDDLDITSHVADYSAVIDGFAAFDGQGFDVDLSFSGDPSESLFTLLDTLDEGSVSGVLSGQIVAVPEPVTVGLLVLGGLVLRRRY